MCLLFVALTFIIFAAGLIFLLLQCSHFLPLLLHFFFCCCFVIHLAAVFFLAFTLGFVATGLVFSAAPFVRYISLLF